MSAGRGSRTALGALSLLVIGAVLGIAADRTLHSGGHLDALQDHMRLRQQLHEEALSEFQGRLDLDDEQRRAIDSVFRRHQVSVDAAWEDLRPHVQSAVDSVHAHIESILRPDQREAFRAWLRSQAEGGASGSTPRHE